MAIAQVMAHGAADMGYSFIAKRHCPVLAVPYSRVSSTDQASGLGLDRQASDPARYCEARGWTLYDGPGYSDAGVSAYGGKNLSDGALSRFLADVKVGRFGAEPVALLIEDLDRFSRAMPLAVLPVLVDDVLNAGVTVSVMAKGRDISRETIKANGMELHELLFWLSSSHEFSQRLSRRISHVHQVKRDQIREGRPVTPHSAPVWIDLDSKGQWVLNDYAVSIRRVADLALAGHGLHSIATVLNAEGIPSPGQCRRGQWAVSASRQGGKSYKPVAWSGASVRQVLRSPALIGDRQIVVPGHKQRIRDWQEKCALLRRQGVPQAELPKHPARTHEPPQRGYYPAVVSEAEQAAILVALERRKPKAMGQVSQLRWIGAGLSFCSCGEPIGATCSVRPDGAIYYLRCRGRVNGTGCRQPGVRLLEAQAALLTRLSTESFLALVDERKGGATLAQALLQQLQAEGAVAKIEAALAAGESLMTIEVEVAGLAVLTKRQVRLERQLAEARRELVTARAAVQAQQTGRGEIAAEAQQQIKALLQTFANGADEVEYRRAVHRHLERLGVRVHVNGADQSLGIQVGDGKTSWQPLHGELAVNVLKKGLSQVFYLPATPYEAVKEAAALVASGSIEPSPTCLVAPANGWGDIEPGTYPVETDGSIHLWRREKD
ncbi:MAG: recombinase family protein [Synechococcaceae cyanobacterium ELA445]